MDVPRRIFAGKLTSSFSENIQESISFVMMVHGMTSLRCPSPPHST